MAGAGISTRCGGMERRSLPHGERRPYWTSWRAMVEWKVARTLGDGQVLRTLRPTVTLGVPGGVGRVATC
jgi:hypothetical protein